MLFFAFAYGAASQKLQPHTPASLSHRLKRLPCLRGLHGGPEAHKKGDSFNAKAMRLSRPASRALLIIYPLDTEPLRASTRSVIGLALSFPKTSDEGKSFVANKGVVHD